MIIGNATLVAGSFLKPAGRLAITGSATIHLGAGAALAFADSVPSTGPAARWHLTGDFVSGASLRFGTTGGGLAPSQFARITRTGFASFSLDAGGYLVGTPLTGYPAWKPVNAPSGTPSDDFDNDGVANGIEYILGGTSTTNDLAKLPTVSAPGGNIVFTFIRDQASIDGVTALVIEVGENLVDWPDSYSVPNTAIANNPGLTVQKSTPATGKDTVTLVIPMSATGKFACLKVTP